MAAEEAGEAMKRPYRKHSEYALTCICGCYRALRDIRRRCRCHGCKLVMEIDWRPMDRRAVGQDIRKWINGRS